jgi:hypothetical protein
VANQSMIPQSNRSRAVEVRQLIDRCAAEVDAIYQGEQKTDDVPNRRAARAARLGEMHRIREELYAIGYRLGALLRDWEEP